MIKDKIMKIKKTKNQVLPFVYKNKNKIKNKEKKNVDILRQFFNKASKDD